MTNSPSKIALGALSLALPLVLLSGCGGGGGGGRRVVSEYFYRCADGYSSVTATRQDAERACAARGGLATPTPTATPLTTPTPTTAK